MKGRQMSPEGHSGPADQNCARDQSRRMRWRQWREEEPEAGEGMYAALLVEREYRFALFFAVVLEFFFYFLYFRRDLFHRDLRLDCAARKREKNDPHHDSERDDRKPDVVRRRHADQKDEAVVQRVIDDRMKETGNHWGTVYRVNGATYSSPVRPAHAPRGKRYLCEYLRTPPHALRAWHKKQGRAPQTAGRAPHSFSGSGGAPPRGTGA